MTLLGVVLAGGEARRFGSDKGVALLHGRPLIEHAAAALSPFVARICIAGRSEAVGGLPTIADWPHAGLGPLGGICAGLREARGSGHEAVLTIACDMPLVPAALIGRIAAEPGAAYVARWPVLGRWPAALAEVLTAHLAGEDRSIIGWARGIGAHRIDSGLDLPNVNRREDLDRLARGA